MKSVGKTTEKSQCKMQCIKVTVLDIWWQKNYHLGNILSIEIVVDPFLYPQ